MKCVTLFSQQKLLIIRWAVHSLVFEYYSDYRVDSDGNLMIKSVLKPENSAAQYLIARELQKKAEGSE